LEPLERHGLAELHVQAPAEARDAPDALARAPRAEHGHGHHRRPGVHGEPRDAGPRRRPVPAAPVALREDPDDAAPLQQREGHGQGGPPVAAVDGDLAREAEEEADGRPEQLDLDEDVRAAGRAADHQRPVGEPEVVRRHDDRTGLRHVLGPDDAGVPEPERDRAADPAPPARPDRPRDPGRAHRTSSSPVASATSARTASTVSSKVSALESTVTTPSAAFRNSTTVLSRASRPTTCARVAASDAA